MTIQRTPYDTGKRSEPKVWTKRHIEDDDDYGKVDFEDDAGGTLATLYIEKGEDGSYTLTGDANEALKVNIDFNTDEDPLIIQPSDALRANVKDTITLLRLPIGETAEVYWADNGRRAMILVGGEKHVRKQLLINVTDVGDGEDMSAYVKDWATGIRETRIG